MFLSSFTLCNTEAAVVLKVKEGKVVPITGREDPQGCETSKLSHFL
jgi:hypothetical protein